MKTCKCGCGQELPMTARKPRSFIKGHNFNIRTLHDKECAICGSLFRPYSDKSKFCSLECYKKKQEEGWKITVETTCIVCDKKFEVSKHRIKRNAKFCSKRCWSIRNSKKEKVCNLCGKTFQTRDLNAKFCSHSCSAKSRVGPLSPQWKGGVAAHRIRSQYKSEIAKWRIAVYTRDNYTCQHCFSNSPKLNAHHIKPISEFPSVEFALNTDNGITLCFECHCKVHGKKINVHSKYSKSCKYCGKQIDGRSPNENCRSCSTTEQHKRKRAAQSINQSSLDLFQLD